MILFRYFAREVLVTTFTVAVIVLVISVGWRFSGYLEEAASGTMTSEVLVSLMLFRLPGFLELILPISFFLAIMLVYGRLHVDSEMMVLQACGMSPARIMGMTLIMSIAVIVLTAIVSFVLKPLGEREVEALFTGQKNLTEFDTLIPGRFQTLSTGKRVTYTEKISSDGVLARIFMNEYQAPQVENEPVEVVTVIADTGKTQVDGEGRRFLVLNNGSRYSGKPGQTDYQVIDYQEYGQRLKSDGSEVSNRRLSAIPTMELLGASDPESLSEFHWRLSIVLMIPIIALMAIPLSRVNPREGRFTRLIPAMILCFVYVIALSAGRSGLEKETLPLEFGLWWIHGVFIVVTLLVYQLDRFSHFVDRFMTSNRSA